MRPPAGPERLSASVKDFAFDPSAITAKVGDTVTFSNTGAATHNATLDAGGCATPDIKPGSSSGLTFSVAGTYAFHCTIHPDMKGTITVGRHDPAGRQARSTTNSEAPDGRSMRVGTGRSAAANQARNCSRVASAVPW